MKPQTNQTNQNPDGIGLTKRGLITPIAMVLASLCISGGCSDTTAPQSQAINTGSSATTQSAGPAEVEISNSIGMKFRLLPTGEFLMGTSPSKADRYEEEHLHREEISQEFYLGKFEVTQAQWKSVMGTQPWEGEENVREGDDFPATFISYRDADEFCKKLSAREGKKYRLPSEAEWEYACRAGSQNAYSFGNDISILEQYGWYDKNTEEVGNEFAHQVGQRLANEFGLYDMHGNVWEWCRDLYDDDFRGDDAVQLVGPNDDEHRVIRGGSWSGFEFSCRSATRAPAAIDARGNDLGFRVMRVLNK